MHAKPAAADHAAALEELSKRFAPDKRTDRLVAAVTNGSIEGYTTLVAGQNALDSLAGASKELVNNVRLLPDTAVGDRSVGVIKVSVANLRSRPGHNQELATQALLGTPIRVLDEQDEWFLVRTPDGYLAWLEPGAFVSMTGEELAAYQREDLRMVDGETRAVTSNDEYRDVLSAITPGGIIAARAPSSRSGQSVALPNGDRGTVPAKDLHTFKEWANPRELKSQELVNTALRFSGQPYLWGGTSPNGMDCSGFTKMVYYLNGFVIPRDASQQVHAGTEVPLTEDLANLAVGDLLFFGAIRDDGSQRITHVGFYLGAGRLLHAGADNGRITENNLIAGEPLYNALRRKTLLRAKRLTPGTDGVITVADAFARIHTKSSSR
ncbi:C40 family peptidase [Neolewinella antarctica]|uniref:Cell wall-associated NlpC family hydrolase n=1 Tax=Neolewinella antarctica TaxID=442734 RepID=A0ABX0XAU5_9BACT|nr:C40 family peptidase [Neolewinella antarctica]NJC26332.1 cell wall-associated NlpC family hydrolase [Neolewinella antarctica]